MTLVLAAGTLSPPARAEESRGTNRQASLTYEPVAGYDAPPRHPGRLARATGSLMGTHSHDSTQISPEDQGIVHLEEALGRKMDINNHYHGGWDDIAEDGLSWLEYWDVENGRISRRICCSRCRRRGRSCPSRSPARRTRCPA